MDELDKFSLLVPDDFGKQRDTSYMNEQVFRVIDQRRYQSGKPVVIITYFTGEQIKNPESMELQRIFSRLMEMCVIVNCDGKDQRKSRSAIMTADDLLKGD